MRAIITGGSGLIGQALAQVLAQAGYEVIILTRNKGGSSGAQKITHVMHWDGRTSSGWGDLVDDQTAIINLAGESIAGGSLLDLILKRWTPERKQSIRKSRLDAGAAIVQAVELATKKPFVVVQASAVGYYGSRGDLELTEETSPADDYLARVCVEWEASTSRVEELGVRRAIIRTGGVAISTKGGAFPFMMLPFKLFVGGPIGNGKQYFSWMHMKDQVRAIRFLIENNEAQGAFNLCAPQALTNGEFNRALGKVMRRPYYLPAPALAFQIAFGEKAGLLTGSQKQIPKRLLELGFTFQFPEAETALKDILGKQQ